MQMLAIKVQRRLNWYKARFRVNNPLVGRAIELLGNRVRMDGLTYSVAAPQITTGHKSTLAFGLHEIEERELIKRWVRADIPVIELGGGLGVVSCLTNRKLLHRERHVVVEANPAMIPVLTRNREINGCKFHIVNRAIAYDASTVNLATTGGEFVANSIIASQDKSSSIVIQTTTIADLMEQYGFDRIGLVCDIEGIEIDVVEREFPALVERISYLIAETHPMITGVAAIDRMLMALEHLGFQKKDQIGDSVFYCR